jgi:hypothetical protein
LAEPNREQRDRPAEQRPAGVRYSVTGHPSVEALMAEQGTGPIHDMSTLRGDFWPEDESAEEFLETLREWRGYKRADSDT